MTETTRRTLPREAAGADGRGPAPRFTLRKRASGILLHPTSLPGPHGIGDLGASARTFVDFLAAAGQAWWQMLPVGPLAGGNSPYTSSSAFAGNLLLLDLAWFAERGLLDRADLAPERPFPAERVAYEAVRRFKEARLRQAYARFRARPAPADFEPFVARNAAWLEDYALFRALNRAAKGRPWTAWPRDLRTRNDDALGRARREHAEEIRFRRFMQYVFHRQWTDLRAYARARGVGLIGDVPIFVSHDSADVWAHPDLFMLDAQGRPTEVAGVPPDYFSRTGQKWGNPLYRWDVLRRRRYDWWEARLRQTFERFDAVRIDHFIGFVRHWAIPAGARDARRGRWLSGPGSDFFRAMLDRIPGAELIAEDLGLVTPEVKALRKEFELPGMQVLQFAFGTDPEARAYQPHNYARRSVVYTGTHDNDTIVGWFREKGSRSSTRTKEQIRREQAFALRYLQSDGREIHWDMIRLALMSVAELAVFPLQDVLGLGSEARMNRPGVAKGNWEWRAPAQGLSPKLAARLRLLTETYERTGP